MLFDSEWLKHLLTLPFARCVRRNMRVSVLSLIRWIVYMFSFLFGLFHLCFFSVISMELYSFEMEAIPTRYMIFGI